MRAGQRGTAPMNWTHPCSAVASRKLERVRRSGDHVPTCSTETPIALPPRSFIDVHVGHASALRHQRLCPSSGHRKSATDTLFIAASKAFGHSGPEHQLPPHLGRVGERDQNRLLWRDEGSDRICLVFMRSWHLSRAAILAFVESNDGWPVRKCRSVLAELPIIAVAEAQRIA